MTDPRDELLRELARFNRAIEALFETLDEKHRTAHLAVRSRDFRRRIEEAVGKEPRAVRCPTEGPINE